MLPHHNIDEVEDSYLARDIALFTRRLKCKAGNVIDCFDVLKHRWARFSTIRLKESHYANLIESPASMAGLTVVPCF